MQVVHALDLLPKSIFLAGPTPREPKPGEPRVPSWRPDAVEILREAGFGGSVLIPEPSGKKWADHYDDQVEWEWEAIALATVVVFWIPRHLQDMPAFTTNVEFGLTVTSSKVVLGWPEADTPRMGYLAALARRHGVPIRRTLRDTLLLAMERCERPYAPTPAV